MSVETERPCAPLSSVFGAKAGRRRRRSRRGRCRRRTSRSGRHRRPSETSHGGIPERFGLRFRADPAESCPRGRRGIARSSGKRRQSCAVCVARVAYDRRLSRGEQRWAQRTSPPPFAERKKSFAAGPAQRCSRIRRRSVRWIGGVSVATGDGSGREVVTDLPAALGGGGEAPNAWLAVTRGAGGLHGDLHRHAGRAERASNLPDWNSRRAAAPIRADSSAWPPTPVQSTPVLAMSCSASASRRTTPRPIACARSSRLRTPFRPCSRYSRRPRPVTLSVETDP